MHLHSENCEMLIREIRVDLNKCSGIGSLNLIKMSILSKLIYSFNPNPIKIPAKVPIDIDKISLIFIWKGKGTRRTEIVFFFF